MTGYLLDTNIVSETRRQRPHGGVMAWLASIETDYSAISAFTVGEIEHGIALARLQDQARAASLETWLDTILATNRVLDFDARSARRWGGLAKGREAHTLVDAMIAATALAHDLTVATRNVADFLRFGVPVVNPFEYRG